MNGEYKLEYTPVVTARDVSITLRLLKQHPEFPDTWELGVFESGQGMVWKSCQKIRQGVPPGVATVLAIESALGAFLAELNGKNPRLKIVPTEEVPFHERIPQEMSLLPPEEGQGRSELSMLREAVLNLTRAIKENNALAEETLQLIRPQDKAPQAEEPATDKHIGQMAEHFASSPRPSH